MECCFGALKKRWRILKTGVRQSEIANADKVFKTCCSSHNMILIENGDDAEWDEGIEAFNDFRIFSEERMNPSSDMSRRAGEVEYSNISFEQYNEEDEDDYNANVENYVIPEPGEGPRIVRRLSQEYFVSKLMEHFNICFSQRLIKWPSRDGSSELRS